MEKGGRNCVGDRPDRCGMGTRQLYAERAAFGEKTLESDVDGAG